MTLTTDRLNLRPVHASDVNAIHELNSLEETARFNTSAIPENIEETRLLCEKWIIENSHEKCRRFVFVVELKDQKEFIGLIGINLGKENYRNAEVWFKLKHHFWNKGYATEALKTIISFGFKTLKLHRIEAGCAIENIGSIKVLEKTGMRREAHTRQLLPLPSGWSDNYGYAILSSD